MLFVFGAIVVVILLVAFPVWKHWTTGSGAPYVPMEMHVVERILEMAKVGEDDVVYDLGSGDGRIPIMASLKYHVSSVGIELDFFRVLLSRFHAFTLRIGGKAKFLQKNIFEVDLSPATVVTMYLLQSTNEALVEKLLRELRPGTRIVSGAFYIPEWKPLVIDHENSTPYGPLYLYEIGKSNPKQEVGRLPASTKTVKIQAK